MNDDKNKPADQELDELLKPLKAIKPNTAQVNAWKAALHGSEKSEIPKHKAPWKLPLQLVAAMLVGFVLGALLFKNSNSATYFNDQAWMKDLEENATYERYHTNLD